MFLGKKIALDFCSVSVTKKIARIINLVFKKKQLMKLNLLKSIKCVCVTIVNEFVLLNFQTDLFH